MVFEVDLEGVAVPGCNLEALLPTAPTEPCCREGRHPKALAMSLAMECFTERRYQFKQLLEAVRHVLHDNLGRFEPCRKQSPRDNIWMADAKKERALLHHLMDFIRQD